MRNFEPKFNLTSPNMKKMFTKIAGAALMIAMLSVSFNGNAQTTLASAVTTDKDRPKADQ